jgi:hypothetical protein
MVFFSIPVNFPKKLIRSRETTVNVPILRHFRHHSFHSRKELEMYLDDMHVISDYIFF